LIANYDTIYAATSGVIEVGIPGTSGFSITLTSTDSVLAYLAASGPVDALDGDYGDPTQTPSGDFGGEVVALRLNIDFSDSSVMVGTSGHLFGDLTVCGVIDAPSLNGSTVREVLGVAEEALGGGTTTDPITSLDPVVDEINVAFEAGTVTPFANDHLVPGACP
jgi:hypothetical protein